MISCLHRTYACLQPVGEKFSWSEISAHTKLLEPGEFVTQRFVGSMVNQNFYAEKKSQKRFSRNSIQLASKFDFFITKLHLKKDIKWIGGEYTIGWG